jgi:hypothetical protein
MGGEASQFSWNTFYQILTFMLARIEKICNRMTHRAAEKLGMHCCWIKLDYPLQIGGQQGH